ncbi:MAG TPA: SDR family NAD(P)-dependent oxidoreductase [Candidatus Limnocylindria bacterium]|nr:SDR family NAD(P)-dependent oxidoreductase [Candidatus Limnocylindria bacterium]
MDHRDLIDGLLELAVVPSFSSIGIRVRRPLWSWQDPPPGTLTGRTAVITGATGGLGRATCGALAALGARVVLVGRDEAKLAKLAGELFVAHGEDRFPTVAADLSVLAEVRGAAETIRASEPRVDVLVDNAGSIFAERTTTMDGLEASMALMAIGPFALLAGLLPLLRASDDARVIAVTSGGMYTQPIDVEDLDGEAVAYNGPRFYARAKRAQVTLIREWARRTNDTTIAFNAMHPGWARTPGLTDSLPGFDRLMGPILRTPEEGIDTITWLATAARSEIGNGRLYLDRRSRPFDRAPMTRLDAAERRRLWDVVVSRTKITDPSPG